MDYIPNSSSKQGKTSLTTKSLVLLNDDFNDFDHVIDCLVLVCDHTQLQAEQCAVITHNTGSCTVKKGSFLDLVNFKKDLCLYGLELDIR
ncbi:MAG: ATP-dependent Clp protease adaptor ClpS [Flavobacteriales bacterium]|nr:ATP-dependent Clp protease adaptor ClpS [Flavobacteriales bacterium]MBT7481197.1 ATP-dependent Clp protease adaptor ClpS [Flavobacteriales bacterium]